MFSIVMLVSYFQHKLSALPSQKRILLAVFTLSISLRAPLMFISSWSSSVAPKLLSAATALNPPLRQKALFGSLEQQRISSLSFLRHITWLLYPDYQWETEYSFGYI
jgi:hypothetical protein